MFDIQLITYLKVATIILTMIVLGGAFFVWLMPDTPNCDNDNSIHDLGMVASAHKDINNEAN
jgi:hypothetical protein